MALASGQALEIMGRLWCLPETENMNPNIEFSQVAAKKLDELLDLLREANRALTIGGHDAKSAWQEKYEKWMKENSSDAPLTTAEWDKLLDTTNTTSTV